jgi:hypothetical protein
MPNNDQNEVKRDAEVETLDIDLDADDGTDDGDEVVTPAAIEEGDADDAKSDASTDEQQTQVKTDEEQAPAEEQADDASSDAEKPDASSDQNVSGAEEDSSKPVEGETVRERALRKELEKTRGQLRTKNVNDAFKGAGGEADTAAQASKVQTDAYKQLKERGYSEEQIATMEEAIDVIASAKGYTKKSETYVEMAQGLFNDFVEKHPEYKPANDAGDLRWSRFNEILTSGMYDLRGKTKDQLSTIYGKIHGDVEEALGPAKAKAPARDAAKIAAQAQKIKSASHTGGSKPAPAASKPVATAVDPAIRSHFKGFDDDDFQN